MTGFPVRAVLLSSPNWKGLVTAPSPLDSKPYYKIEAKIIGGHTTLIATGETEQSARKAIETKIREYEFHHKEFDEESDSNDQD